MLQHILRQIPDIIQTFLQNTDSMAIRILGDTPNSLLDPEDYLGSIRVFVSTVEIPLCQFRPDSHALFLAAKIFPGRHSYFALDVNNVGYDYETADKDMRLIPVYVLRLSRNPTLRRQPVLDGTVAKVLATMHNGHGYEPLPLLDDHNKLVAYHRPRSLKS